MIAKYQDIRLCSFENSANATLHVERVQGLGTHIAWGSQSIPQARPPKLRNAKAPT